MKISTFRPYSLLMASLLCAAGAVTVMTGARVRAAAPASAAQAAGSATEPAADSRTPATGTEADAAAPGVGALPPEASGTDWEAHEAQDEAADHGAPNDPHHPASRKRHRSNGSHNAVVNLFDDSVLEGGKEAESVVSVFGNSQVEGTVQEDVVSVFGNTYIDGKVGGDATAVFGNVQLGPHAEIEGDVTTVAGRLRRDPAATVHGDSNSVLAHDFGSAIGLRSWIDHCLLYGRPLSLTHGLGWAWGLALSLLALYLCIALVFRQGVERCVETFERRPGHSVLAALLAVLLTPVLIALLFITVVGIAAVPFGVIGLLCVALFGKTVILAWLGRRVLRVRGSGGSGTNASGAAASGHPALAVLIGALLALALYVVPILGFVVYKLLGFLGFGAVVYTAILGLQARQAARNGGAPAGGSAWNAGATMAGGAATNGPAPAAAMATTAAAGLGGAAAPGSMAADPPVSPTEAASPADAVPPTEAASPADAVPPIDTAAPGGAAAPLSAAIAAALPRAGFWIRMAALLLDVLLVGLITRVMHSGSHAHLILLAAYGAVMWKLRGSTVGGIVFDLRVVRPDGREMDWETAIIRALSCFLSLAVAGLGFFWIAFDDAHQAWHDKIAGTVVVRVPKARSGA